MKIYSMRHNEERDIWTVTVRNFGDQTVVETRECMTYGQAKRWIQKHKHPSPEETFDLSLREPCNNGM